MSPKLLGILLPVFCVLLFSCTTNRYIHAPTPANNPFFREKNESKVAVYGSGWLSTNGTQSGYDAQAAYSFTKHFYVGGSFYKRKENDKFTTSTSDRSSSSFITYDSSSIFYNRSMFDATLGYFTSIDKNDKTFLNLSISRGTGSLDIQENGFKAISTPFNRYFNIKQQRYTFMEAFNFYVEKDFAIGLSFQQVFTNYSNLSTSYTASELNTYALNGLTTQRTLFFDFSLQLQAVLIKNLNWLYFNAVGSTSLNKFFWFSNNVSYPDYKTRFACISIGLSADLTKLKKSKR